MRTQGCSLPGSESICLWDASSVLGRRELRKEMYTALLMVAPAPRRSAEYCYNSAVGCRSDIAGYVVTAIACHRHPGTTICNMMRHALSCLQQSPLCPRRLCWISARDTFIGRTTTTKLTSRHVVSTNTSLRWSCATVNNISLLRRKLFIIRPSASDGAWMP